MIGWPGSIRKIADLPKNFTIAFALIGVGVIAVSGFVISDLRSTNREVRAVYDGSVNGLDLIRHARSLEHRRHIPIIMLSATPNQAEAQSAGADVFLRKPEDIYMVTQSVKSLLDRKP